ncbi:unnamed protein product [Brassicogethes aeneus]|uniref:Transmembrane protein n=1 Tax=Brassicogethes aeneus TaxID=1431903 RepID=A0A9P0FDY9_BRAAE|nr:unnamed protein product [Brassicogethes aeneus]
MEEFLSSEIGLVLFLVFCGTFILFSIIVIVIASVGFYKCPAEGIIIPLCFIVAGVGVIFYIAVVIAKRFTEKDIKWKNVTLTIFEVITAFLAGVPLGYGTIRAWKLFEPSYDEEDGNEYCAKYLYFTVIVYSTTLFAVTLVLLVISIVQCIIKLLDNQ